MRIGLLQLACIIAALGILLAAGGTNPTNSLELTLTPSKGSFDPNEPIRVTAKFYASEGTVCFNTPRVNALDIELFAIVF
jgi:hypothetical protein